MIFRPRTAADERWPNAADIAKRTARPPSRLLRASAQADTIETNPDQGGPRRPDTAWRAGIHRSEPRRSKTGGEQEGLIQDSSVDPHLDGFIEGSLLLDLETGPTGGLLKIGAIRGDDTFVRQGAFDRHRALTELDAFAAGCEYLLGHNLLGHDLPTLRALAPVMEMLRRPVVDTLHLSPLAFPENPYHRLVKNYKLVRDAVSDPIADARLAAAAFREQWMEFGRRRDGGDQDLLRLYRYCFQGATELEDTLRGSEGLAAVFAHLGAALPHSDAACELLLDHWRDRTCSRAAPALAGHHLTEPRLRPAAAYATARLQVAGARSVLPPWVGRRFPETAELIRRLRDVPCGDQDCTWCAEVHDPRIQLRRWFGFGDFRPAPTTAGGGSLQEAVVTHDLGGGSQLAILPTGGGKSLCFQLPALTRNLRRGTLTVVISPLQALMKDQVDNLVRKTGTTASFALYGMLTPPERGEVLERVRLGDAAMLYVSPEQLRNASFRGVLETREIGCWVFDEAHCLSKWGHDFRPDYLYAGRFIKELATRQGVPVPPVACFTATAKRDVTAEILAYFRDQLGLELTLFEGGVERDNLSFEVQVARVMEKPARVHAILHEHLAAGGAAVIYASTRQRTEELSEYLRTQGWAVEAFHAGISAPQKRRVQDAFVAGELRVICATNAFGMGVDKEDVRLVVHLDIPGSLENYVQEAGRAGRDREPALCVLLYDEQDVERQFKMEALSELTRQDIAEILRGLRRARRGKDDTVVLTSGELLRDDDLRVGFDAEDRQADTRVRVAVAWLERSGLVERDENRTHVFQGRPAVANLAEARRRIAGLGLSAAQQLRWMAVLEALINAEADEAFTADELARLPAFKRIETEQGIWDTGETAALRVLRTLHDMAGAGLLHQGPQFSAFLRHKVKNSSGRILVRVCALERAMLETLRQEAPEAEMGDWQSLSLRRLNQRLLDQGQASNPETLRNLLTSLARDGRGLAGERGSLEFRQSDRDHYMIKLHRGWGSLIATAERRQAMAAVILSTLVNKLPRDTPAGAELLVSFGTDELTQALQADITLGGQLRDPLAAADRGLMFLHEQGAVVLQRGLGVFRQAMTIRLLPQGQGRGYSQAQYQPLAQHYGERVFQIHVMNEYARLGAEKIRQALALITAYFTLEKASFVQRFFPDRREVLERATTAEFYQRIVDALRNPDQGRDRGSAGRGQPPGAGRARLRQDPGGRAPLRLSAAGSPGGSSRHPGGLLQPQCGPGAAPTARRPGRRGRPRRDRADLPRTRHAADRLLVLRAHGSAYRRRRRAGHPDPPRLRPPGGARRDPGNRARRPARPAARGLSPHPGGRVPGHRRRPVPSDLGAGRPHPGRGQARLARGGGRRPEHLLVSRRQRRSYPSLPGRLPGRGPFPGRELPFERSHHFRRQCPHRPQPRPPENGPADPGRRASPPRPGWRTLGEP
jgi:ATP-dependent DNA helicase RecQ